MYNPKHAEMTLLDFLIANAPTRPEWFKPTMRERPTVGLQVTNQFNSPEQQTYLKNWNDEDGSWLDDATDDELREHYNLERKEVPSVPQAFKAEISAYVEKRNKQWEDNQTWQREYDEQITFQWPVFYAGNVLAIRNAQPINC